MAFRALSSQPGVIPILYIPEMFHFRHSSHLWVASTWNHEPESILIVYPFRVLSSRPKVVFLIHNLESFFPFRALSSRPIVVFYCLWPRVIFFPFRALTSRPRVILSIQNLELTTQSRSSHLWPKSFLAFRTLSSRPKVVLLICDPSHLFMAQSHSWHSEPWAHDPEPSSPFRHSEPLLSFMGV